MSYSKISDDEMSALLVLCVTLAKNAKFEELDTLSCALKVLEPQNEHVAKLVIYAHFRKKRYAKCLSSIESYLEAYRFQEEKSKAILYMKCVCLRNLGKESMYAEHLATYKQQCEANG